MRTVMIAAVVLTVAGAADAQQMGMAGPGVGASYPAPMPGAQPMARRGQHWGGRIDGRWTAGVRAPGGYAAYHRLSRGYVLPSYWSRPGFTVGDWSLYGLQQPPYGYRWTRYYDDAVLVDRRGSIAETVDGIDWDRYDLDVDSSYAGTGYGNRRYQEAGYGDRRSNGVGGAVVGGALGAGAGALIAGRHDKVGGALLGAGAGAIAGYAIDRSASRGRYPTPPRDGYAGPGTDYPTPGGMGAGYGGPYRDDYARQGRYSQPSVIESGGGTTVITSGGGGSSGYYGGYGSGYYYPGSSVTTVTIASAPVVTTTTEVYEDSVTYSRVARHHVYHRRVYHRLPTCGCRVR